MSVLIRPLRLDDVPEAVTLLIGGALGPSDETPEDPEPYWAAAIETRARGGEVFVADEDGSVVGVCQVMVLPHFQHRGRPCCEIESVHVREDRRSRGVGAQLLGAAERLAAERGCYRVQLTSNKARADAHRFYETHGYVASHQGFKKSLE